MFSDRDDSFFDELYNFMTVVPESNTTNTDISVNKNKLIKDPVQYKEIEDDYENVGNEILPTYDFTPPGENPIDDPYIHQVDENSNKSTIVIHIKAHGKVLEGEENTLPEHLTTNTFIFAYAPPNTVNMATVYSSRNYAESIEHALSEKYPIMPVFDTVREKFTNNDSEIYKNNADILKIYKNYMNKQTPNYDKTADKAYKHYVDYNRDVKFKRNANMFIPKTDMLFESSPLSSKPKIDNRKTNPHWTGCSIKVMDVRYPKSQKQQIVFEEPYGLGDKRGGVIDYRDEYYTPNLAASIFHEHQIFKYKPYINPRDIKYTTLSAILNVLRNELKFDYIFIEMGSCRSDEFDTDYHLEKSKEWKIHPPTNFPPEVSNELRKVRNFSEQKEEIDNLPDIGFIRTLGGTRRRRIRHRRRLPTYTRHNTKMRRAKRSYKRKHNKTKKE